jgi:branched-subunit amino acid transport protein
LCGVNIPPGIAYVAAQLAAIFGRQALPFVALGIGILLFGSTPPFGCIP